MVTPGVSAGTKIRVKSFGSSEPRWVVQINRRLVAPGWLRHHAGGTELALAKIDKLVRFYENSPFYETTQARELLLTELQDTRERWAKMTWAELVSEHNGGARPGISGN